MPTPEPRRIAAVALALAAVLSVGSCRRGEGDGPPATTATTSRHDAVAEHSREVMPFDLSRARHTFSPTAEGLVETVETLAPVDDEQVRLIRDHLQHEAERFRVGDWSDPARIHGDDMPGLAELRAGSAQITVDYEDVPAGGRLTYTTTDPALVDALHRWGDAQTADHGHHEHAR